MATPVLRTSNRSRERGIVALMFTKRQPGYRGGYWVLLLSGNCCQRCTFATRHCQARPPTWLDARQSSSTSLCRAKAAGGRLVPAYYVLDGGRLSSTPWD